MSSLLDSRFFERNEWSFSRHSLWMGCKRAYFFQYMGTYYTGKKEYDSSRFWDLKKYNSKIFLQGSLVHEVIKNQLGQHKLKRPLNEESAINHYLKLVDEKQTFADAYIVEVLNGESINTAFFEKIKTDGVAQIKTFFSVIWPNLKDLEYRAHEEFEHFRINAVPVTVKPDYVTESNGHLVISDWKTGSDNENYENDLQIATYVLWAKEKFALDAEKIHSELIYLSTGNIRSYDFTDDELEQTKSLIIEDFKKMNETYDFESYLPNPSVKLCNSCRFSKICKDTQLNYT